MEAHVKAKGKWKRVKYGSSLVSSNAIEGFAGLEVLYDYEMTCAEPKTKAPTSSSEETTRKNQTKGKKTTKSSVEIEVQNRDQSPGRNKKKNQKKGKPKAKSPEDPGSKETHRQDQIPGKINKKKQKKGKAPAKDQLEKEVQDQSPGKTKRTNQKKGEATAKGSVENEEPSQDQSKEVGASSQSGDVESSNSNQKTKKKKKRKKKTQKKQNGSETGGESKMQRTQDKKRKNCDETIAAESLQKKKRLDTGEAVSPENANDHEDIDMSAWSKMYVPEVILKAMKELKYTAPTPIQALALPSAIRDKMDVVGAAETGSGKTLAFGIPVLHHILEYKSRQAEQAEAEELEAEEDIEQEEENMELELEKSQSEEGIEEDYVEMDEKPDELEWDEDEILDTPADPSRPLLALVLAPTRELAIQVQQHLKAVAKYTGIQVAAIVGGMATQKQERILKKCPEILVATPGRLYELIQQGQPHLSRLEEVRCLVIDEADRMVEKGHFEELAYILLRMNRDENKRRLRQNFVFSATLTFVHSGPNRLILKDRKKKQEKMTQEQKLESLGSAIGIKSKHKLIDLTSKKGTVEQLTEARINCVTPEEKDLYLYYFLTQYPGRTIVFGNSKDSIRRLCSVLTILQCKPLSLHADMHQKQRLKSLDKFKADTKGLLLATDVAARGLDIPQVDHVIHFQVPRTTENYIHRSGRTARATREGLSIMLVSPSDMGNYRKIVNNLNRDEDLPLFPMDSDIMSGIKARVNLARDIDQQEHRQTRAHNENTWFLKAAKEADLEVDEEDLGLHDMSGTREHQQKMQQLRHQLHLMLQQKLTPRFFSAKYPTKSGKLIMPLDSASSHGKAVGVVKQEKKAFSKELKKTYTVKSKAKPKSQKWKKEKKWMRMQKKPSEKAPSGKGDS